MKILRLLAWAAALALSATLAPAAHAAGPFDHFTHPYPPAARDAPGHRGGSEKSLPSSPGKPLQPGGGTSGSGNATGNTGSGSCDVSTPFYPWPQRSSLNIRFLKEGEVLPAAIKNGFPYNLGTVHAVDASWVDAFQHAAYDSISQTNLSYQVNNSISINNYSGATGYDVLILAADGLEGKGFDIYTSPDNGVSVIAMRSGIRNLTFSNGNTNPNTVYWVGAHHEFGHTLGARDMPDSCWTTDGVHLNGPDYGHSVMNTHWNWDQTTTGTWPVRYLNFDDNTFTKIYP